MSSVCLPVTEVIQSASSLAFANVAESPTICVCEGDVMTHSSQTPEIQIANLSKRGKSASNNDPYKMTKRNEN